MAAQRPDGKNPAQRVSFTRQGADRIARVVRTVERGDRKANALRFGKRFPAIASKQTITVITGVVLSTSSMTFLRSKIQVTAESTHASQVISVYNCPSGSYSSESQAFFFG